MAEQSITIKIADKTFPLRAANPEMEQMMRLAAERINEMLGKYNERFPDKSLADKLTFVALNETVARLMAQKANSSVQTEIQALEKDIAKYLKENKD
ncbi:MAG: cell division protein ZapA [Bacteroidales bacterium]|nr:cell division protein ZapA [Bacteroidales bacterium]